MTVKNIYLNLVKKNTSLTSWFLLRGLWPPVFISVLAGKGKPNKSNKYWDILIDSDKTAQL